MGFFTRKTKKEKLNDQYKKKLEQAYKMSTSNRTESDRLTAEANEILEEIKTKLNQIISYLNAVEKKLEGIIPYTKSKGEDWKKD